MHGVSKLDEWRVGEPRPLSLNASGRRRLGGRRRGGASLRDEAPLLSESDRWVEREKCNIFYWDVANASNTHLPQRYVSKTWMTNKFSAELWLQRALKDHPWRTHDSRAADVVHLGANFSLYCRAGKLYSARFFWRAILPLLGYTGRESKLIKPPFLAGTESTPKLTVLTDNECTAPWAHTWRPHEVLLVTDHGPGKSDFVAPFVVSRPAWLVAPDGVVPQPPGSWASRPLLFFTGHVPKLYINPTRYLIWRQIRRHPGVLAISATINCTIGQFAECANINRPNFSYFGYCTPYCRTHGEDDLAVMQKDAPGKKNKVRQRCASGRSSLRRYCGSYKHVSYASELADMAAATRNFPPAQYFDAATRHRFCLNAPGDFVSTPKITEFVVLGGAAPWITPAHAALRKAPCAAGGCLPVMVLKGRPRLMLPYTRWLDWCGIAVLVSESTARGDMRKVLAHLEAITEAEAEAMRARLQDVRNAFSWRPPHADPMAHPSAADYVLAEGCHVARQFRQRDISTSNQGIRLNPQLQRPPAPDPTRCIL